MGHSNNIIMRLSNISVDMLLFGNVNFPALVNEEKAVQTFIRKTKRF